MTSSARQRRRALGRAIILCLSLALAAGFLALGIWQVERRAWKHALIAAVDARIHAAPVAAPGPEAWPWITAERDAYRRVRATGRFVQGRDTLVRAVSDLGSGYWVMTPLDTGRFIIIVNRGFVAQERRDAAGRPPEGTVAVAGLLRVTEPGGGFLRRNDPGAERWYSRDIAAIARAWGIGRAAPYFIDADRNPNIRDGPVGGLTVVRFSDNHLGYALTWFALAALSAWGGWRLLREGRDMGRASG